jgi:hypothetical protein
MTIEKCINEFDVDDVIFEEGSTGRELFVVLDGQVFGTTSSTFVTAPISGRVTDIAIDPNSADTVYAATAQGGLWRSLNAGADWEPLTDFAASLACGSVTVDPSAVDGLPLVLDIPVAIQAWEPDYPASTSNATTPASR